MKIVKHIFYVAVWVTLGLYLIISLLFSLPSVQGAMARRAAAVLSDKLGTRVSIGSAEVALPNHLTLKNVTLLDQRGEPLLRSARISARIDWMPLAEGRISIATAQLFGTHVRLYADSLGAQPNYQFLIDSLASRDTTASAPLDLRINSLIVRHSSLSYDCRSEAPTPGVFNPHHVALNDISMHLALKALREDSLNASIRRLSLAEHSGLKVDRLSLRIECGPHESHLHDFSLLMPGTRLELGDIDAAYKVADRRIVTSSLRYMGSIRESYVTPSDLACFSSALKNFKNKVTIKSHFHGHADTLTIPTINMTSETGDIRLTADGWAAHLDTQPTWHADIHDLALSAQTVGFISENLKGQHTEVPAMLARMGDIHLTGLFGGTALSDVNATARLSTDAGRADIHLGFAHDSDLTAQLTAHDIDLGKLLGDPDFGLTKAHFDIEGTLPRGATPDLKANGTVGELSYRQYTYRNISIEGAYNQQGLGTQIAIDDPYAAVTADCHLQQQGPLTDLQLSATILALMPGPLHLTDQWGDAKFTADIEANYRGTDVNDAVGSVYVSNFAMLSAKENYELNHFNLYTGWNDQRLHFIAMHSDFGEARLTGNFDYATLAGSFTNAVGRCLPTLPGLPPATADARNNFALTARLTQSDWLQHLAGIDLRLDEPIMLEGNVNDATGQIAIECNAPLFHYSGGGYRDTRVGITSTGDSLLYDVSTRKLAGTADRQPLDLHVNGYANDNLLTAFLDWDNHAAERMSGVLNVTASFDRTIDGRNISYITINPSELNIQNKRWTVDPSYIAYSDRQLDVGRFSIHHEHQYLNISGTASDNDADTLHVRLQDIDADYLLALVDFDAVDFDGLISGSGSLRSPFGSLEADGHLTVSRFEFQHGRMGTLTADVDWNKELQQIDIHAVADDGPDAKTYVDGYVSPQRDSINLLIRADSTYLDFAQSFLDSFISHIDGRASGSVRLIGPLDAINLTGQLVLNGSAHVKTLGCTYQLRNDTLRCIPNEMEFASCAIYDAGGNRAILTGGIHHNCLTDLTYDIYCDADNLLAYHFTEFGDDTFYATAYASGRVGIHGRDGELRIEGDLTPERGTTFVYNAATPDAVADQAFITWGTKRQGSEGLGASKEEQGATKEGQGATAAPDYRSDVYLTLRINATPNATVRLLMDSRTGDYITLRGTGVLNTSFFNKGGFQMFGTYRVAGGTYELTIQDIIKKNFTFAEGGTATFSGDPYDAQLNLQAQYTVNGVSLSDLNVGRSFANTVRVNCLMNIEGQVKAPQVSFDLDLPNVNTDEKQMVRSILNGQEEMNQQVVYLLAVGRFYPQGANNAADDEGTPQRSQTSLAMQSLLSGTLSGQINSVLNSVINNSNWNFGANISTGDEGWNNAEYEGLVSGRMLNNRLLINGQFGYRDNATTAQRSFIGDFDIRYLLLPNGNLALKVYNQTNDRYFTRSSLNTQGIGIIMKKDFSSLSDLFK